jgi:dsDNA-specific endonuclease/ATPase MutS2
MWPFTRKPKPPTPSEPEDDGTATDEEIMAELAQELGDELDLHHFKPKEVGDVVEEYLHAAQAKGFARVRIIHGKGVGNLRRTVESVLEKHPAVKSFQLAGSTGGWGATAVELHPADPTTKPDD